MTTSAKWLDLADRVGWTFVQALAAAIYAAGSSSNFTTIDWPATLIGAGIAAALALLKVGGVNASVTAHLARSPQTFLPRTTSLPAPPTVAESLTLKRPTPQAAHEKRD